MKLKKKKSEGKSENGDNRCKQKSANHIFEKMNSGNHAGSCGEDRKQKGENSKNRRKYSKQGKEKQSKANQKGAGCMAAGKGAAGFMRKQGGKRKNLGRSRSVSFFANQGGKQKAKGGDNPVKNHRQGKPMINK